MKRSGQTYSYTVYVLVFLLAIGILLTWQAWSRASDFRHFHKQLAVTAVTSAAYELEILLNELRRSMRLFAENRQALFENIFVADDNDELWAELETTVQKHFPEYFGVTLTDQTGNVLRPDFDNRVSEICQQDIQGFIDRGYREQGHIHPNPLGYHFDIMVPWGNTETPRGVFFLSFRPDILTRILRHLQPPGHKLLLVRKSKPDLIEVTGQGARDSLRREFFLNPEEQKRIVYSLPIAGRNWDLVDLPTAGLFQRDAVRNWSYAIIVFCVFAGVTLLMLQQLRRKEKFRMQAENRALQHQNDLAHAGRLNILGEMASGMAHELNQPLSAISTYCQSGLRIASTLQEKPEKLIHALEESSLQAKRAGKIINRMRQFASKGKSRHIQVDMNRIIENTAEFVRPETDKQNITLHLRLSPYLPPVLADSIQIEQVILNLLHNAIEAITGTDGELRVIEVYSRQTDAGQIEVAVHDTGPGLDPETISKLFDTFYSTKENGMGLGLAISRSIIEAHDGQLWAGKQTGAGASFYFSLPASGAG